MRNDPRSFIGSDDGRALSHAKGTKGYDQWRVPAPPEAEGLSKAEYRRLYGSRQKRRFAKYNVKPLPAHRYDPVKDALYLFPDDCYKPTRFARVIAGVDSQAHGSRLRKIRICLENEASDDLVARLENAILAGAIIPEHLTEADLATMYVPPRQVVAFAYATILPHVRANFSKATRLAQLPMSLMQGDLYKKPEHMFFLSQFWRERIAARSGILMLYGEEHAAQGNAQMARLLGEMSRTLQPEGSKTETHDHKHVHFEMPYDGADKAIEARSTKVLPPSTNYKSLKGRPR